VINSNLTLACTVSKLWPIGQIFAIDMGVPHFNAPRCGRSPANIRINFTSPETRWIVLSDAENRPIICSFMHLDKTPECYWRTDRQTDRIPLACTELHHYYTLWKKRMAANNVRKRLFDKPVFMKSTFSHSIIMLAWKFSFLRCYNYDFTIYYYFFRLDLDLGYVISVVIGYQWRHCYRGIGHFVTARRNL